MFLDLFLGFSLDGLALLFLLRGRGLRLLRAWGDVIKARGSTTRCFDSRELFAQLSDSRNLVGISNLNTAIVTAQGAQLR